jgi:DNA invertase Pin-like site-specific DNA recombinase
VEKKTAIYVRVSTDKQENGLEAQLMACKEYCAREGITNYEVFSDFDESGGKTSRPEFDRMLSLVDKNEIRAVLVYCNNRLTRDTVQAMLLAAEFRTKGIPLLSCSETNDLTTPEGRLLYGMLAVVAQYQREDIVRKVNNGLDNAKRKGVKLGRKKTRDDEAILALAGEGLSPSDIAATLDISRGAVYRALKASETDRNAG